MNLINALGACGQTTPLNLNTSWDGWAINRMRQLQIGHLVMVTPIQVAYQSHLSWTRRVELDISRLSISTKTHDNDRQCAN